MTTSVASTGGVTDKFIGDAVMAFWGPPFTPERHAEAACRAAVAQLDAIEQLRAKSVRVGWPIEPSRIGIRVGVATGEVVAGSVGAPGARSYTVVGDTVNVAARLEAANKDFDTSLIVDANTRDGAGASFEFRSLGAIRLRGRRKRHRGLCAQGPDRRGLRACTRRSGGGNQRHLRHPGIA